MTSTARGALAIGGVLAFSLSYFGFAGYMAIDLLQNVASAEGQVAASLPCPPFALPLYDRDEWGAWRDADGDCQKTRDEVLARDAADPARVTFSPNGCKVTAGSWVDPYDGRTYVRTRDVEIDHVVSLAEAHRSGAWAWSPAEKLAYFNDLANLVAAGRSSNRRKSDHDPAGWQPDVGRCAYARQWLSVKRKHRLTLDADEAEALAEMISADCPRLVAVGVTARELSAIGRVFSELGL